jgi:DUF1365 family protein
MIQSAIYRGTVRHRRAKPVVHAFRYRMFMVYLDLDDLPGLFDGRWFWSARRPAPAWFRRADHLGDPAEPLGSSVRRLVQERSGITLTGPIRLLTHLRYWGYVQNPVSFYYCFDTAGEQVEAVVAEVTNTPWGERHAYVLTDGPAGSAARSRSGKALHVSPFMSMDQEYRWRLEAPGETLDIHMMSLQGGARVFDANLRLRRAPFTGPVLAKALLAFPWMTASVLLGIYWQALRLWWKDVPFHPNPRTQVPHVASAELR